MKYESNEMYGRENDDEKQEAEGRGVRGLDEGVDDSFHDVNWFEGFAVYCLLLFSG